MASLSALDRHGRVAVERQAQLAIMGVTSLEQAAQAYVTQLFAELGDSLVLVRAFAALPFADIEPELQARARELAGDASLGPHTPILTLLGTAGREPAWCDRHRSAGHAAIPLVSPASVSASPMIAALLVHLGLGLDWLARRDSAAVAQVFGMQSGVFHVEDAATSVDGEGRKIIAAEDFVAEHGVRSAFGVGGGYVGTSVYVVIVCFASEAITREQAASFRPHIARFKAETLDLVRAGALFERG